MQDDTNYALNSNCIFHQENKTNTLILYVTIVKYKEQLAPPMLQCLVEFQNYEGRVSSEICTRV